MELDGLLSSLMTNPELLGSVLSMAGKLSEGISSLSKSESEPPKEENALLPAPLAKKSDMHKHKKLVEALMLYVGEEKRPKLELVLKILEIVELAEGLRG